MLETQENQPITRYLAIAIIATLFSLLLMALIVQTNKVEPSPNASFRQLSTDGESMTEVYINIPNSQNLRTIAQSSYRDITDQLLLERYAHDQKIERYATIEGGIKSSDTALTFAVKFWPSNQKFNVIATKPTDTEGVSVELEPKR